MDHLGILLFVESSVKHTSLNSLLCAYLLILSSLKLKLELIPYKSKESLNIRSVDVGDLTTEIWSSLDG